MFHESGTLTTEYVLFLTSHLSLCLSLIRLMLFLRFLSDSIIAFKASHTHQRPEGGRASICVTDQTPISRIIVLLLVVAGVRLPWREAGGKCDQWRTTDSGLDTWRAVQCGI